MRMIHVAVFNDKSTNTWQANGFEELGVEVVRYDYRVRAAILGQDGRDESLIELCQAEKPNFVLFSKCNKMHWKVVEECGKICKVVLWYMDDKRNLDKELIDKAKRSDLIFASRPESVDILKEYAPTYRLQGGFNPTIHKPIDTSYAQDVAFIGDVRPERQNFHGFKVINDAYGIYHSIAVSSTKINLNFTLGGGTSNRLYKILAARGFLLTQPYLKMEEDFTIGKHLDIFTDQKELKEKVEYYLKNEEERENIAYEGWKQVQNFNHINYARRILEGLSNV